MYLNPIFRKSKQAMTLIFAVSYRDVYSGKYGQYLFPMPKLRFFGKSTKAIIHGFAKKWCFRVGNGIELFYVRMYVYMTRNYMAKIRVTVCYLSLKTVDLYVMF